MECSSVVRVKRGNACADDNTQACQFRISACLQKGATEKIGTWAFCRVSKIHTCRVNQKGREMLMLRKHTQGCKCRMGL